MRSHLRCCGLSKGAFEESNCKLLLPTDRRTWIALSGTSYQTAHCHKDKLCDLLVLWRLPSDALLALVIELKSGALSADDVHGQLSKGAEILNELLDGLKVSFLPLLVHGPMRATTVRQLDKPALRVRLNSKQSSKILPVRCGSTLDELLRRVL